MVILGIHWIVGDQMGISVLQKLNHNQYGSLHDNIYTHNLVDKWPKKHLVLLGGNKYGYKS